MLSSDGSLCICLGEQFLHGVEDALDGEILHTAVMLQGADALHTRTAGHVVLKVYRVTIPGISPGDIRGTVQRYHRDIERRRKMSWATIGADQQAAASNACLGQSDTDGLIGQALDPWVVGS